MKALQYSRFGEPTDVVGVADVHDPVPGPGEVRLRVVRSPIHNHDLATIRGVYGVRPALPATGGSEMLGVVEASGDGIASIARGTRVVCITRGAWAEYALASASTIAPVPDAIPDDAACQLLSMPMSALVLLDELHVHAGEWIVQNAANGAVGKIVMREAQKRGINVINLVRRASAAGELRALGAEHVVVMDDEWTKRVAKIAGKAPIVRAIDSVAGPQSLYMQRLLGTGGELVVFGGLSGEAMRIDPGRMISHELRIRGFWMTSWMRRAENAARIGDVMRRVFELALLGEIVLPVAGVYPLSESHEALTAAEEPGRGGKILFSV